jgi:hypothetical protein
MLNLLAGDLDFVDDALDALHFFRQFFRPLFLLIGFDCSAQRDDALLDVDFERAAFDHLIIRELSLYVVVNRVVRYGFVGE